MSSIDPDALHLWFMFHIYLAGNILSQNMLHSLDLLSFRDRSEMIERIPRKWKTSRSSIYEKKHGRCMPQHGGDKWEMLLHQDCRAVCYLTNQDPSSSNVETNGTNDHIFHTLLRTPLIRFLVVLVFYIR